MLTQGTTGIFEDQVLNVQGQAGWVASPRRQALGKEDLSANQLPPFEEMSRAGDGSLLSRKLGTRDLGFIHCPWALLFCQVDFFNSSYARSNQQLDAA